VPRDDQEAAKWYHLAAEQGHAKAQYRLGSMYVQGKGVPEDYVLAHMWLNLGASKLGEHEREMRNFLSMVMTPQQIAEAQRLAREWKPKGE